MGPSKSELKSAKNELARTLYDAKLGEYASSAADAISYYAPPERLRIQAVRRQFNNNLKRIVTKGALRNFVHVTGVMSALADPLHRTVLRSAFAHTKTTIDVLYHLPAQFQNPLGITAWNRRNWTADSWRQNLAVLDLISNGICNVYAQEHAEDFQFSVSPEQSLAMVQSIHQLRGQEKWVWIVASARLCEALRSRAEDRLTHAREIAPSETFRVTSSLSSIAALDMLFSLRDVKNLGRLALARRLRRPRDFDTLFGALDSVGFVVADQKGDTVTISKQGLEFLKLFQRQE